MPDLEKVRRHLQVLNQALENLEKYRNCSVADLKSNLDLLWILERGLYLAIQNLIDIFAHIVSADLKAPWEKYSEVAGLLSANEIISSEEEEVLQKMIGFRNRLSHEYLSLSQEVLVDIVNNRLGDIVLLRNSIIRYCRL
ncbi:MAG: DUF86 domain-containing protein [Ignavibacteriaceae bacterium]|nr:DUF86 domain-containing protein [Ignavibacteriaceae bacterium]